MFVKGKSGNPGGRPKAAEDLKLLAQTKTQAAINTLCSIMSNKKAPESARVSAACALLDRGYGKPSQMIESPVVPPGMTDDINMMELARRVAFLLVMGEKANQKQPESMQ